LTILKRIVIAALVLVPAIVVPTASCAIRATSVLSTGALASIGSAVSFAAATDSIVTLGSAETLTRFNSFRACDFNRTRHSSSACICQGVFWTHTGNFASAICLASIKLTISFVINCI
jgi:hypothetical protein